MRVSTQGIRGTGREQTFDRQVGIFEGHGYVLDDKNTFSDHISGSIDGDKRDGFNKLLKVLKPGDTVCFTETSRFARNYISAMQMLDTLTQTRKVNVNFVSNGIRLDAGVKYNPYTWFIIAQMLIADEKQRRDIGYNTSNALQKIKADGKHIGRKSNIDSATRQSIKEDIYTMTYSQIAKKYKISKSTVCNIAKGN